MSPGAWSRAGSDASIQRWWGGEAGALGRLLSGLAVPAEMLFRLGVHFRNHAYDRGLLESEAAALPVLSVGNLVVGGTGKTPVTAWLARLLASRGERPVIVLRGYGRDEVELHRRWNPAVPVVVAPRRVEGVREAASRGGTVAVLDDAFQHRSLRRDGDVVLVAAEDPMPPRLLPRGPYREPLSSLQRAHLVIVTRRTATETQAVEVTGRVRDAGIRAPSARIRLRAQGWMTLAGAPAPAPDGPILAVAGVARPEAFAAMLRQRSAGPVEPLFFPDHHEYGGADVDEIVRRRGGRTVVTTEKDAVKLQAFGNRLGEVRVLRLGVEPEEGLDHVLGLIDRFAPGGGDGALPRRGEGQGAP